MHACGGGELQNRQKSIPGMLSCGPSSLRVPLCLCLLLVQRRSKRGGLRMTTAPPGAGLEGALCPWANALEIHFMSSSNGKEPCLEALNLPRSRRWALHRLRLYPAAPTSAATLLFCYSMLEFLKRGQLVTSVLPFASGPIAGGTTRMMGC